MRGPEKIAVVHIKGHQKGTDFRNRGNNAADQEAKQAALRVMLLKEKGGTQAKEETIQGSSPQKYTFTEVEKQKLGQMGIVENPEGKWILADEREVLPKALALQILDKLHRQTHWGGSRISRSFCH